MIFPSIARRQISQLAVLDTLATWNEVS